MSPIRSLLAGAALLLAAGAAQASPLSFTSSLGGAATGSIRFNFDNLSSGTADGTYATSSVTGGHTMQVGLSGSAQAATGNAAGLYAAPFLSSANGNGFGAGGGNQGAGADATPYLSSGSTGAEAGSAVTLHLPFLARYLGILWGSVDGYNTLSFFNGNTLVGSIGGGQVVASPTGDQGVAGTRYVNINSALPFDRVVASATQYAFEFDNVALIAVPEPATLGLFGLGLAGIAFARRRRAA